MINEQYTYERIENYLKGTMSEQDRNAFQIEIESNKDLSNLVDQHKSINKYTQSQGLIDFKKKLKAGMPKAKKSSFDKRLIFGSLGLISLISVVIIKFSSNNESTNSETVLSNTAKVNLKESSDKISTTDVKENVDATGNTTSEETTNAIAILDNTSKDNIELNPIEDRLGGIHKRIGTGNDIESNIDETQPLPKEINVSPTDLNADLKTKDCDDFDPRSSLKERASFNSMGEGKIEIKNLNKEESYYIYIDENTRQKDDAVFEHLEHGSYQVSIENDHGCIYIKKYTLTTKKID